MGCRGFDCDLVDPRAKFSLILFYTTCNCMLVSLGSLCAQMLVRKYYQLYASKPPLSRKETRARIGAELSYSSSLGDGNEADFFLKLGRN